MKPVSLRTISGILITLCSVGALTLAGWLWKGGNVVVGDQNFEMLEQRAVKNVTCSGECSGVSLASNQLPGTVYFSGRNTVDGSGTDSCTRVMLWANQVREDQVAINGYALKDGFQTNLRPVTVDLSALTGDPVEFPVIHTASTRTVFSVTLRDAGDGNLIDRTGFSAVENTEDYLVKTEYETGDAVTLLDECADDAKAFTEYTLYQSPNLGGPGEPLTYLVALGRMPDVGADDAFNVVSVFEKNYTEEEMSERVVHVTVADGDTTFDFDLVSEDQE